jgi:hypothetical protein
MRPVFRQSQINNSTAVDVMSKEANRSCRAQLRILRITFRMMK